MKLDIYYEDNHIIVVYKPKGVLSQPDGSNKPDMLTIIKDYIKTKYEKPGNVWLGLVHRLDINTSGIMVFAKSDKAASRLSEAIRNKKLHKTYSALVEGYFNDDEYNNSFKLENKILKNENLKKSFIDDNGKDAILYYKPVTKTIIANIEVSKIEVELITGRFHQIRCQMANINHPLYGDKKYGAKGIIDNEEFPLECFRISFPHPITKEILEFNKY